MRFLPVVGLAILVASCKNEGSPLGASQPLSEWRLATLNGVIFTDCNLNVPWALEPLQATRFTLIGINSVYQHYYFTTDSQGRFSVTYDYNWMYHDPNQSNSRLSLKFPKDSFNTVFAIHDTLWQFAMEDSFDLNISMDVNTPLTADDTLYIRNRMADEDLYIVGPFSDTTVSLGRYNISEGPLWGVLGLILPVEWGLGLSEFMQNPRKVEARYEECSGNAGTTVVL